MARGDVPTKLGCDDCYRFLLAKTAEHKAEVERLNSQLAGAVNLLREIGAMAGARANGADARAMAKRAREFVTSLDQPGGQ
jgi:hypothetical protein